MKTDQIPAMKGFISFKVKALDGKGNEVERILVKSTSSISDIAENYTDEGEVLTKVLSNYSRIEYLTTETVQQIAEKIAQATY